MNSPQLIVVGTSHISRKSVSAAEDTIRQYQPDIVAVELDKQRFLTLFHKRHHQKQSWRQLRRIGVKAFLFLTLASKLQNKIGKEFGMLPGSEMKKAIETAAGINAKVALVDQHILLTARKLNKALGFKVFLQLFKDALLGMIRKGKAYALLQNFDVESPSEKQIKAVITYLQQAFPSLYAVLLEERNKIMYQRVHKFLEEGQCVVLIVGAAHKEGIEELYAQDKKK